MTLSMCGVLYIRERYSSASRVHVYCIIGINAYL